MHHTHLRRRFEANSGLTGVDLIDPDQNVGTGVQQRLDVALLGPLIEVVGLPDVPAPLISWKVRAEAETFDVQTLLDAVNDEPRPVDDERPEPAHRLPLDFWCKKRQRLLA